MEKIIGYSLLCVIMLSVFLSAFQIQLTFVQIFILQILKITVALLAAVKLIKWIKQ